MSVNLITSRIEESFFNNQDRTVVTWLGMAGALINARGVVILIDPLITAVEKDGQQFSEDGHRLKVPLPIQAHEVSRADFVCYTHADDDHLGRMTAKTLATRTACQFLAPPPVAKILRELGIDEERISITRDYQSVMLGLGEIIVIPALHDYEQPVPWKRGDCCGFLVKSPDGTIWHPGDTRLIDELLTIKDVDVLFFDVAAVEAHLGPEGSARLGASSAAKAMLAYHYGTFDMPPGSYGNCDPEDALPYLQGVPGRYLRVNPGELLWLPLKQGA